MKQLAISIISLLIITACSSSNNPGINILDYGANPDGITINTAYIQDAIDACHANGGGTVLIPPGEFVT